MCKLLFYGTFDYMAVGGRTNIEQTKDNKLRYLEEDNVVNVTKDDLTALRTTLKVDEEQDLDAKFTEINNHVENYFDGFLTNERENNVTLTINGASVTDSVKNIVMSGDQSKLKALTNYVIDKSQYEGYVDNIKDAEIKEVLNSYEFELNDLWKQIEETTVQPTRTEEEGNVLLNDLGEETETGTEEQENYNMTDDYIDPFDNTGYATIDEKRAIENIYKDDDVRKSLERIFDKETEKELHRGTFRINLSVEDGLAGVIIAIREAMIAGASGDVPVEGEETDAQKLYAYLSDNGLLPDDEETGSLKIERKDIVYLMEQGLIPYEKEGILNFEKIKLAKILSNAKRSDLDEFASLLQSKPDIAMAVKERNNALEITGASRSDKYKEGEQSSLINDKNVLSFLCDYNSDGQLSAAYYEKDKKATKRREAQKGNKLQENQGDVGTIFGQQIFFTIEQAIKTKNIELGDPKGEQFVIYNIVKNMQIDDNRNLTGSQRMMLDNMGAFDFNKENEKIIGNPYCTKENLAKLINGNLDESLSPMPTFKIYFLDAIKKINGGSQEVNPDLYDTLVGKEAENMMALYENEANLKTKLDEILQASQDPVIQALIKEKGLVRVRETMLIKVMSFLNNVTLTFNDGTSVPIGEPGTYGVSKAWEIRQTKNELLETTRKNLVQGGIAVSPTGNITLSLGFGQSGVSESLTRKWSWNVGSGVTVGTSGVMLDIINISGDIEFQYNKNRVISADLSKVKSAKYLGLEGSAGLGIGIEGGETVLGVKGSAGINRSRDPEIGINQIDKQYRAVSEEIFDVNGVPLSTLSDKKSFTDHLKNNIQKAKSDETFGDFVANNEQHLTDNMNFIVKYMEVNHFFGEDGIFKKYPDASATNSVNALLDIIQSGNIEMRRHDVIAGLHGKIALTKLSFGLTTSMFTLKTRKKETPPPPVLETTTTTGVYNQEQQAIINPEVIENTENLDNGDNVLVTTDITHNTPVTGTYTLVATEQELLAENVIDNTTVGEGTDKYGAFFMYVGARVSTRKNMYAPNVPQYLFTQYEIGQGVGTEYLDNPTKDLAKYGEYLVALYNDPKNRLSYSVDAGRLILHFTPEGESDLTLARFLNLHATAEAQGNFSLKGNDLIIGNVGDIGAYTVTEAKGVRRVLCLGSKKLDEATRVAGDKIATVEKIKPTEESNKERTQEKITTDIIPNMKSESLTFEVTKLKAAQDESKLFFDGEGKLTKPAKAIVTFKPTNIEGNRLTTGTLSITKNIDGSYIVELKSSPNDQLKITYIDQKDYEASLKEENKKEKNLKPIESQSIENLFSFEGDMLIAKKDLTTLLTSIEELEDIDHQTYADFLDDLSKAETDDGIIDDEEIGKAIVHLESLMAKSATPRTFDGLKTLLDGNDYNVKAYIVDRFKQILAREPKKYIDQNIGTIVNSHIAGGDVLGPSMNLLGPGDIPLPADLKKEMKEKRDAIKTSYATTKYSETPTVNPNLIGYTAFYRPLKQRFSLTALGETGYQGSMETLSNTTLAQDWFLKNFGKNKYEVERLATALETKFEAQGITINLKQTTYEKTLATIESLLKGDTITLDSGGKISIDVKRVFYLLGDCCNESLGVEITKIKFQKPQDNIPIQGVYSASGIPDKTYQGGIDLYYDSHHVTNRVVTQEMKVSAKGSKNVKDIKNMLDATTDTGIYK